MITRMKKLLYLGEWVILVTVLTSCLRSGEDNIMPEIERKVFSTRDTIVILDPGSGREIRQVIEIKDTVGVNRN